MKSKLCKVTVSKSVLVETKILDMGEFGKCDMSYYREFVVKCGISFSTTGKGKKGYKIKELPLKYYKVPGFLIPKEVVKLIK